MCLISCSGDFVFKTFSWLVAASGSSSRVIKTDFDQLKMFIKLNDGEQRYFYQIILLNPNASITFSFYSARPVYLQEVYGGNGTSEKQQRRKKYTHPINEDHPKSSSVSPGQAPPERPPKKPYLRSASRENSPPPQTPPRGHTPSVPSRPPSRTSPNNATPAIGSTQSSRVSTPTAHLLRSTSNSSSIRCRPKFPSPPGSPAVRRSPLNKPTSRRPTDELPLPPPPELEDSDMTITNMSSADGSGSSSKEGDDKPTLR